MVNQVQIVEWLYVFASVIEHHKEDLTELDAAIGDADHGINMDRGFKKVSSILPSIAGKDISSIFKNVSMTLISSIGGASGPLYGTWFLRASSATAGKQELTQEDMLKLLQSGLDGVIERGKTQLGDKTMVDVLSPAVVAFEQAVGQGMGTVEALQMAVAAAEQGLKATIPMLAKKGRASYLGDRSIGHQDPGGTSAYWMLRSLLEVLKGSNTIRNS
ncbi:dihydroxyacetone kinase subunit L [Anabaena cylindrica FACHB-243]|uniref:Dihydroxyacetone kinase DhaL subunit n=1 Tax=Anabaena cylindrica (strain ATCC 27899 / PCC 7122) TaxID=272123 RepID=K9ZQU8_ANACC|nr:MULTISPECIES: dihydroxyacetone kinase subunit DhaL [Anabaena]AFZ60932.1 dihydroxyacetone kinase DhaL subunit [Anabaena cylindrica PCC 7122]MBD2420448.1 dihydroxyacetone kinase subunit L [Anabaena cylindrica FACHB-243]MBY5282376.1 dihydroxyacetone kinase subunit L [Anabaena sp. CCAP 1446/1C]MBY5306302.1 dihydroxyacetone kinase subunit L [Anabaena sp. CCAP 1446/1C]MCM2406926.1 dihydroxyacetone kinase subunit DhaL [Anabaena sp. CCAP 1446/1C]